MTDVKGLLMVAALVLGVGGYAIQSDEVNLDEEELAGRSVSGETIVRWNQNAVTIANGPALPMMRELAIVHIAMHDAANAVERHYKTYSRIARDRRADPALAAAAAAHDALVALKPSRVAEIDAMFQTDLARVTDADKLHRSLTVGAAAANAILARRADDGSNAMVTYTFGPVEPGVYQPVPPAGTNVAFPHWPDVTPFVMTSGSQFRQAGPVSLSRRTWARDYNEVREFGRIDSIRAHRRPDPRRPLLDREPAVRHQHHRPHRRDRQRQGPLGHCPRLRAGQCRHHGRLDRDLGRQVPLQLLAPLHRHPRPRWRQRRRRPRGHPARSDLAAAERHPGPPGYPCAHCELSAAGSVGLTAVYGSHTGFTITTSTANPAGSTRTYHSFDHQVEEASASRTWGGFHYRFSREDGKAAGYAIGHYILRNKFRPDDDHKH